MDRYKKETQGKARWSLDIIGMFSDYSYFAVVNYLR